mmetsp:Transcript_46373/g.137050  ORF Transcript_46373/g.137050 Transcript_46373/m.137050 type:complete len:285 (+) Transcript_46373:599-1453(+)
MPVGEPNVLRVEEDIQALGLDLRIAAVPHHVAVPDELDLDGGAKLADLLISHRHRLAHHQQVAHGEDVVHLLRQWLVLVRRIQGRLAVAHDELDCALHPDLQLRHLKLVDLGVPISAPRRLVAVPALRATAAEPWRAVGVHSAGRPFVLAGATRLAMGLLTGRDEDVAVLQAGEGDLLRAEVASCLLPAADPKRISLDMRGRRTSSLGYLEVPVQQHPEDDVQAHEDGQAQLRDAEGPVLDVDLLPRVVGEQLVRVLQKEAHPRHRLGPRPSGARGCFGGASTA